ncbi:MAG: YveK family protein [Christensenellales bacterium]|jgi:capsular polysaccharide biosynthesis protein
MSINKEQLQEADASVGMYNKQQTTNSSEEDLTTDLLELMNFFLTNLRWIIAAILLSAIGAFVFTRYYVTPVYRSTGSIYVVSPKDSVVNLTDFQIGNYLASDYVKVVYTWEVLQQTRQNLKLDYSYEELRNMVSVTNPANTRILEISIVSTIPEETALIANELMNVVSDYVVNVMETEKPNILSEARIPAQRFSPSFTQNTMKGAFMGGFFSVLILFVIFILDDKVKTSDDALKYAGLYTLAIIPRPIESKHSSANQRLMKKVRISE